MHGMTIHVFLLCSDVEPSRGDEDIGSLQEQSSEAVPSQPSESKSVEPLPVKEESVEPVLVKPQFNEPQSAIPESVEPQPVIEEVLSPVQETPSNAEPVATDEVVEENLTKSFTSWAEAVPERTATDADTEKLEEEVSAATHLGVEDVGRRGDRTDSGTVESPMSSSSSSQDSGSDAQSEVLTTPLPPTNPAGFLSSAYSLFSYFPNFSGCSFPLTVARQAVSLMAASLVQVLLLSPRL